MKLSISRAASIQWLALGVDWKGLVTCTQSQLDVPSSRSRMIFMMCAAGFGLSGLRGQLPDLLA